GAPAPTATGHADPRQRCAGERPGPLSADARQRPGPAALRPQPAEQEGVPAAREAPRRRPGHRPRVMTEAAPGSLGTRARGEQTRERNGEPQATASDARG